MNKLMVSAGTVLLFFIRRMYSLPFTNIPGTKKPSAAPDYFCTWNEQGYVSSFASTQQQRNAMTEQNLFGKGRYENWTGMFRKLHADLYFVLDDAWDVPLSGDQRYYGSLVPDTGRFPSLRGMTPAQR